MKRNLFRLSISLAVVCAVLLSSISTAHALPWGFADLHVHQFANLGFGGLLIWGEAYKVDDNYNDLGIEAAIPRCDYWGEQTMTPLLFGLAPVPLNPFPVPLAWPWCPEVCQPICPPCIGNICPPCCAKVPCPGWEVHGIEGTRDVIGNALTFMERNNTLLELGHNTSGYDQYEGWPRWDSYTHQQVYYDWLHRAYVGGLRLMVMHTLNNKVFCDISNQRSGFGCDDMDAVDRQIDAAWDFQKFIDLKDDGLENGSGWYRIVTSPSEARQAISENKLAVVLGIEVDDLFHCLNVNCTEDSVYQDLVTYYNKGVRNIFPIHIPDNNFGGAAVYGDEFNYLNKIIADHYFEVRECKDDGIGFKLGSDLDPVLDVLIQNPLLADYSGYGWPTYPAYTGMCNQRGLTDLGRALVNKMMDLHMIIEVDHMSAKSMEETMCMAESRGNYSGIAMGHTGFVSNKNGEKRTERDKTDNQIETLRKLGGMLAVGVHTGKVEDFNAFSAQDYNPSYVTSEVPNDCGFSSKTWAQQYLYAVQHMQGGAVAFGSDLNGFGGLPAPRFGDDSEACNGDDLGNLDTQGNPSVPWTYPVVYDMNFLQNDWLYDMHFPKSVAGNKTYDFNYDGMAHIGMYPDFINDLREVGLNDDDLKPLFHSAEAYVTMWEKAVNGPTCSNLNYPIGKWQRVWRTFPDGVCLGDGPDEISQNFDNDWGDGITAYCTKDKIQFSSSRSIKITSSGIYRINIGSDDGIMLYIDEDVDSNNPKLDRWYVRAYTTDAIDVFLTEGYHKFRLDYFENDGGARVSFEIQPAEADLAILDMWYSPSAPAAGETVTVTVGVRNVGGTDADPFYVFFYKDLPEGVHPNPPGDSETASARQYSAMHPLNISYYSATFTYSAPGTYNIWAYTDAFNEVPEAFEDNNAFGPLSITVKPAPRVLTVSKTGCDGDVTADTGTLNWGGYTGTASYPHGTSVVLTATDKIEGFNMCFFAGWSGEGCSGLETCKVTMDKARNVTAQFSRTPTYQLTVTKSGQGSGIVTADPGTLNWSGNTGSALYPWTTPVILTEIPGAGSIFTGWSGGCLGTGLETQITVSMNEAILCTANFVACPTSEPVRMDGSYYASVEDAYESIITPGKNIQVQASFFPGPVTFDGNYEVALSGGYDCNYSPRRGYTILGWPVVVGGSGTDGSIVFDRVTIK